MGNYNEQKLAVLKIQLDLAKTGFNEIVKNLSTSENVDIVEIISPYVFAIKEIKEDIEYHEKAIAETNSVNDILRN